MKEQQFISHSGGLQYFEKRITEALAEGWVVVPRTLHVEYGGACWCVVEREVAGQTDQPDAELGRLVRQMPDGAALSVTSGGWWASIGEKNFKQLDTPEEALRAALKETE